MVGLGLLTEIMEQLATNPDPNAVISSAMFFSLMSLIASTGTETAFTLSIPDVILGVEDVFGSAYADTLVGDAAANSLAGGAGNDTLRGGVGDDRLWGEAGNDVLDGGTGADRLTGGFGDDTYYVDDLGDRVVDYFNAGSDTVYSAISYTLSDNVETLRLLNGADHGFGNGGHNLLVGNSRGNTLFGGSGNDTLWGADGNDRLIGGSGRDVTAGGTGADRFAFDDGHFGGATTATADVIQDFSRAQGDRIELAPVDANSGVGGDQAFTFIGTAAFTGTAGQLRYGHVSGNTYVLGDLNGDGAADFMLRLDGLHTLTSGNFIL